MSWNFIILRYFFIKKSWPAARVQRVKFSLQLNWFYYFFASILNKIAISRQPLVRFGWNFDCELILGLHCHLKGKVKALKPTQVKIMVAQNTWQIFTNFFLQICPKRLKYAIFFTLSKINSSLQWWCNVSKIRQKWKFWFQASYPKVLMCYLPKSVQ